MKIEFKFIESTDPHCFAKVNMPDRGTLWACGDTWEQAEKRMRKKLANLKSIPPPPEPIEI